MRAIETGARQATFFLLLGACFAAGCSGGGVPTYPVKGQVSFPDGTTLPNGGYVVFVSTDLDPPLRATGAFGVDGKFQLTTSTGDDIAVAGNYNVSVVPNIPDRQGELSPAEYQLAMKPIDARYMFPRSSGLSFTVSAETSPHEFKIEVTKPRRKRR